MRLLALSPRGCIPIVAGAGLAAFSFGPALAHVMLEPSKVKRGATVKAAMTVGHGCAGSPTRKLRVRLPPGVLEVVPLKKPGWSSETIEGAYDHPWMSTTGSATRGAKEIVWSGTLPPHAPGTFEFAMHVAKEISTDKPLVFPVIQECEKGVQRWIELSDDARFPAPSLVVEPAD